MKYLFSTILLILSFSIIAQNESLLKWNQIPEEDLQMTDYPLDSSAAAVVLADYGQIIVELEESAVYYRYKRHRRIKVLDPVRFNQADVAIPYYTEKKDAETITYLKAQSFAPDGTKMVVANRDMLDLPVNEFYAEKQFTFPQIAAGSVIEYRYEIVSPRITNLRDWYFQEDIPVRSSRLKVEIPNAFKYFYFFQGNMELRLISKNDRALDIRGNIITKTKDNIYQMSNVPALKPEKYITTVNDHRARLRFLLKEIKFPGGDTQPYLSSWNEVSSDLLNQYNFGKQFTDEKMFGDWINPETEKIISSDLSDKQKAAALYQYLSETIKWNEQYHFLVNKSLNEVFLNKRGNSGEINLIFLALLRRAGITAHPVLISTRSHGRMAISFPVTYQFNHVLLLADINGEETLLDAGNSTKAMNYPNINSLNKNGWLLDSDIPRWIDINAPVTSTTTMATLKLNEDGTFSGKLQGKFKGYAGMMVRNDITKKATTESYPTQWNTQIPNLKVDSTFVRNLTTYDQSLHLIAQVKISGLTESKEDLVYFKPVFITDFSENTLTATTRTSPVEVPFSNAEHFILNLEIPDGYRVESLPEPVSLSLEDDGATYSFLASVQDNFLQLISKTNIKKTTFPVAEYEDLRELFIQIENKLNEKIVLKKMDNK